MDALNLADKFEKKFGVRPDATVFSPGRVNLIGEHIDYCGGLVLPMAINQGTFAALRCNGTDQVRVYSSRFDELCTISIDESELCQQWTDFIVAVLTLLRREYSLMGVDLYVEDTISAGGLSSSASFALMLVHSLLYAAKVEIGNEADSLKLAKLCQQVENDFIGVACGIMDQASIVLGGVVKLACDSLSFTRIAADFGEYQLVIMDSGKERTLAASKYNERVGEIGEITHRLNARFPVQHLCQIAPTSLAEAAELLSDETLVRRLRHVVTENERVSLAAQALSNQNLIRFGELLNQSHQSLSEDYEVTGFELDSLVGFSQQQEGVLGARMTGAGFGGCCISLVKADKVVEHNQIVGELYARATNLNARFILANVGEAVSVTALPATDAD